jgi:hypothetical protein
MRFRKARSGEAQPWRAAVGATRLARSLAVGVTLAFSFFVGSARADDALNVRATSQIAGYNDTVGVSVLTPSVGASVQNPTAGWGANGLYLLDVVTAASPDVVATASPKWQEIRQAGNLNARYKPDNFGVGLGANASYSNDYLALGANAQLIEDLDDKNLTLTQRYAFGRDTIGRTDTPFSVFSHHLTMHALSLGLSRVVNPVLVFGLVADGIIESGDQSKPYRFVPLFEPEVAPTIPRGATAIYVADNRIAAKPLEQLPLHRDRIAVTGSMRWRTHQTTVRLEERLYADTWALLATTTDFRWLVDVSERVTVWPHLRVHAQKGVEFWQRAYAVTSTHTVPILRTGDRELGPLSNFGVGGGIRLALGKAARKDDVVLSFTGDGTWTSFIDDLYVKNRFSGLATASVEAGF